MPLGLEAFSLSGERACTGFLTGLWQCAPMPVSISSAATSLACMCVLSLAACSAAPSEAPAPVVNEVDPYLARALNDPLMIDPDLSWRNEANAAITIGHDHALPSFKGSDGAASRARETARLELLESGPIPDLPATATGGPGISLAAQFGVEAVLDAISAPAQCRKDIIGDFAVAQNMPDYAKVMPHGMVRVAAAVYQPRCELRLVRYITPVTVEDALQYHYTLATRSGFQPAYYLDPEASIEADRRGRFFKVFARPASGDLTAVDIITWEN